MKCDRCSRPLCKDTDPDVGTCLVHGPRFLKEPMDIPVLPKGYRDHAGRPRGKPVAQRIEALR